MKMEDFDECLVEICVNKIYLYAFFLFFLEIMTFKSARAVLRCWIQVFHCGRLSNFSVQDDRWTCNTNGMNFNEGNNEQPCVPDAHGFSSLTVNSSQKRQEVEEMVFSERYFETRGPTAQRTTSKIITA